MMQFRFEPQAHYLLGHLSGLVTAQAWAQVLPEMEEALKDVSHDRMLVDLSGLLGWLGEPERRDVGALMARHFVRMRKVALVIERRKITGVVEAEAQRNGLNLRLFAEPGDALDWLLE